MTAAKAALYHLPVTQDDGQEFGMRATQGQAGLRSAPFKNNALLFAPRIVFRFC